MSSGVMVPPPYAVLFEACGSLLFSVSVASILHEVAGGSHIPPFTLALVI